MINKNIVEKNQNLKYTVGWGTKIKNPDWESEVLIEGKTDLSDKNIIYHLKIKYPKYNRFRVLILDNKKPNFNGIFGEIFTKNI